VDCLDTCPTCASTGLCIFQKRLEKGTFAKLWRDDGQVVRLTSSELALYVPPLRSLPMVRSATVLSESGRARA
jgi:hypothetical protein